MTASGLPPDMRARMASLRNAGLNTSVSTACCQTSIRCGRHLFLLSSACTQANPTSSLVSRNEVVFQTRPSDPAESDRHHSCSALPACQKAASNLENPFTDDEVRLCAPQPNLLLDVQRRSQLDPVGGLPNLPVTGLPR